MLRISWFLLFISLLPLKAEGSPLPSLPQSLSLGVESSAEPALPDPNRLTLTWWEFFNTEGESLSGRIAVFREELEQIAKTLPAMNEEEAFLIRKIIVQLNLLAKTQRPRPRLLLPTAYRVSYTLDEQMEMSELLHQQREKERELAREVNEERIFVQGEQKKLDLTTTEYLETKEGAAEKLLAGLKVIYQKLKVVLAENEYSLHRELLKSSQEEIKALREELTISGQRLNLHPLDLNKLNSEIDKAHFDLKIAQDRILRAEAALSLDRESDTGPQNTQDLFSQDALRAAAMEVVAQSQLLFLDLKALLVRYGTDEEELEVSEVRQELQKKKERLDKTQTLVQGVRQKAEGELEKIGKGPRPQPSNNELSAEQVQLSRYREVQQTLDAINRSVLKLALCGTLIEDVELLLRARGTLYASWWYEVSALLSSAVGEGRRGLNFTLFKVGEFPITVYSALRFLLIIAIGWFLARLTNSLVERIGNGPAKISQASLFLLQRFVHYSFLIIAFFVALASVGIDFSNILILVGVLSVGIGFGLQTIVNNFFSSLIILFSRQIRVGDMIELPSGQWGTVRDINIQNTIIRTWDGIEVLAPNAEIISTRFCNWTLRDPYKRLHVSFRTRFDVDKEHLESVAVDAAYKVPSTASFYPICEPPRIWLKSIEDWYLQWELIVWVNVRIPAHRGAFHASYMWELETALRREGYDFPLPIYLWEEQRNKKSTP